MMNEVPDAWTILKFSGDGVVGGPMYKVLAGWYGGYTGSDSWRLNSGISRVEESNECYFFHGHSGSVYQCYKNIERMTGLMSSKFEFWRKNSPPDVSIDLIEVKDLLSEFTAQD